MDPRKCYEIKRRENLRSPLRILIKFICFQGVAVYELIFFGTFVVIYLLIPDYFNNYREKNQDSVVLMGFMSLSGMSPIFHLSARIKETGFSNCIIIPARIPESMKVIFVGSTLILGILSLLLAILLLIAAKSVSELLANFC